MREMKDSGVEWIGKIPKDWLLERGKYIFLQRNQRGNKDNLQLLSPTQKYGVIPQLLYDELSGMNAVKLNEKVDLSLMKTIHNGDYCISLRSFQGGFEYSKYEGVVSPAYQVFYPQIMISDGYYKYLFKDSSFIEKMNSFTMSLRDGKNIAYSDFSNSYIPYPPVSIQKSIANYLDYRCSEIDSLSADIQKQIDILNQYKQSVITETVTKGLDKNAEMKDSGVKWIGKMPKSWSTNKIKYLFRNNKGLSITKENLIDNGLPVLSYGQIHSKNNTGVFISDDLLRYVNYEYQSKYPQCQVYKNDFIFADTSEDYEGCGNCVYKRDNSILFAGYHSIILQTIQKQDNRYFAYLFKTDCWRKQIREVASGVKLFSISQKSLTNASVIAPPLVEQLQISDFLDAKCSVIYSSISDKQKQLDNLAEYKKSLIYEYVTGKKEVPTANGK